jgi:hypothetical protein
MQAWFQHMIGNLSGSAVSSRLHFAECLRVAECLPFATSSGLRRFNHESKRMVVTMRVVTRAPSWSSSVIEMAEYGKRPDPGVSDSHIEGQSTKRKKVGCEKTCG